MVGGSTKCHLGENAFRSSTKIGSGCKSLRRHYPDGDSHLFSFVSCQVDVCPKWLVLKSFNYFRSLHEFSLARINLITIVIIIIVPLLTGMM